MKKIMIALAVAAVAVFANAGTFNWKTAKTGGAVNLPGTSTALASGTAYLFLAADVADAFTAWSKGETWTGDAIESSSISSGKIAVHSTSTEYASGEHSFVFITTATVGGTDYFYVSNTQTASIPTTGNQTYQFAETATSSLAAMDKSAGYKGAGWYGAVPEPTSGLLLLIGMAGLALRRRRA